MTYWYSLLRAYQSCRGIRCLHLQGIIHDYTLSQSISLKNNVNWGAVPTAFSIKDIGGKLQRLEFMFH